MIPKDTSARVLHADVLSSEAFKPYGHVVQAYAKNSAPNGTKVTQANQGSALKFHKLSPVVSSYPTTSGATSGLSVYRCQPLDFDFDADFRNFGPGWPVRLLERHSFTNQAFVPMGIGSGENFSGPNALEEQGTAYLVVVALNGDDDKPNLSTLRAFVAGAGQSVVYATGVWRECPYLRAGANLTIQTDHPMVALETVSNLVLLS